MNIKTTASIIVVLLLVVGFISLVYFKGGFIQGQNVDETVICPLDVKQCPDGSYVSRVAPSCEFAACGDASTTIPDANSTSDSDWIKG